MTELIIHFTFPVPVVADVVVHHVMVGTADLVLLGVDTGIVPIAGDDLDFVCGRGRLSALSSPGIKDPAPA
jgi:hypothetical protein